MICPGCGETNWPFCKKCDKATLWKPRNPEYSDLDGYVLDNYPPEEPVVEGTVWDGTDFFRFDDRLFVSQRARVWLTAAGAWPVEFKVALLSNAGRTGAS
jgi:hypothetical protein